MQTFHPLNSCNVLPTGWFFFFWSLMVATSAVWTSAPSRTETLLRTEETTSTAPPTTTETTTIGIIADELLLQLTGGPNRCAGNVEVFYFGGWAKVCGYLWDLQDAQVACRQLGCGSPLGVMQHFPSSGWYPYMMTEVDCTGSEDYLWECPFKEEYSGCYSGDASVICSDSGLTVPPPTSTTTTTIPTTTERTTFGIIADELLLQLTGGPNRCAGNVEVFYFGGWAKVCGYLWDLQDAQVACRQLGCGSPLGVMQHFPSSGWYPYMMTEVDCTGSEDYLWECPFKEEYSGCYSGDASVICSDSGLTVPPPTAPDSFSSTSPVSLVTGASSCGGLLQGLSGSVQSPGYPDSYPNSARCVWRIQLRELDRRVELQFLDVELEGSNCRYDAIEVYDGGSPGSPLLGTVCRNDHQVFKSSGHQLTILFRSDISITRRGFEAYYYSFSTSSSTTVPGISSLTPPVTPTAEDYSCGGLLSSPSGTFQSPFYPRNYPNNANCVWEIEVKSNFHVTLTFRDVQMEGGRCLSDYVEVYDGPLHTSPLLGKLCSGSFHTYTSSSNLLTVRFYSNSRYTYRGFQAEYYSTPADQSTSKFTFKAETHFSIICYLFTGC
ncbi:scavenger receptor cysteine-rich domain-containing protein DMBT1-like isoform X1 [Strix uralensis]|uniref:scavenger receptor cysteine-rich domain-containing protein DMBT1-like isoform X1 n=1 Tax=Strix uralensis TaxID=36305 RepID=UPI003DA78EF0